MSKIKTSASALNALSKGKAEYLEYVSKDKEPTKAIIFGSSFHAFCLENLTDLSAHTIKEQELLYNMRDSLTSYEAYTRILNPSFTENEEFIEFGYKDVIIRSKIDQWRVFEASKVVIICDLKSCRDVSDKSIYTAVADYGLLTQLACYELAIKAKYPNYASYKFILMNCFVSKEAKPKCRLINWSTEDIETGRQALDALINKLMRLDELTIDNNNYTDNNPIPEAFELPFWALKNYNKNIEDYGN